MIFLVYLIFQIKYKYAGGNIITKVAWHSGNADEKTHPVGRKQQNELGIYDMSGNVREWCLDIWHRNYKLAPTDGSAWLKGGFTASRVIRGGSWQNPLPHCRTEFREKRLSRDPSNKIGFRLVQNHVLNIIA